ncbi:unnamed protein product [Prorocentrum cordatum]|uniref:Uncharacterized protein n=1 Tax=Prorocentrum cordatum TaxID=2364126 RepID=A0ABN9QK99_9DINO|nr:unnamed protein product [Polarella glacialis]
MVATQLELQVKAEAFDRQFAQKLDAYGHGSVPQQPRGLSDAAAPQRNASAAPARQEFPDLGSLGDGLLDALGARAEQVAPDMTALDVANIFHAYALLLSPPSEGLLEALGRRAQQTAGDMGGREVASVLDAFARLGETPQVAAEGHIGAGRS